MHSDNDASHSPNLNSIRHSNLIKYVPKYSESMDIEDYLLSFEKAISLNDVGKDKWSRLL